MQRRRDRVREPRTCVRGPGMDESSAIAVFLFRARPLPDHIRPCFALTRPSELPKIFNSFRRFFPQSWAQACAVFPAEFAVSRDLDGGTFRKASAASSCGMRGLTRAADMSKKDPTARGFCDRPCLSGRRAQGFPGARPPGLGTGLWAAGDRRRHRTRRCLSFRISAVARLCRARHQAAFVLLQHRPIHHRSERLFCGDRTPDPREERSLELPGVADRVVPPMGKAGGGGWRIRWPPR
jgi:hypothetical protein